MIYFLIKSLFVTVTITLCIAFALILSQKPGALSGAAGLDFSQIMQTPTPSQSSGSDAHAPQDRIAVMMRDGTELQVGHVAAPEENAPLLILVHGSGWQGMQFDHLAAALSQSAEILIPDLRGHGGAHGAYSGRRGDVDYIGQLEDDIADLIKARAKSGQEVILAGHSSGGGLVVRFAGGADRDLIDRAVLLAPFLKYNAPTTRQNSGGWARVLNRRIIGLTILNAVHIRLLNHLTVIQFNMPQSVLDGPLGETATTAYSYRMNISFAPRTAYLDDIAQLPPFMVIAGTDDEAFFADQYQPLMSKQTDKGAYHLIAGVGHLAVVNAPETATLMRDFIRAN